MNKNECPHCTLQAIMAEGKEHAVAVGLMKMSSEKM